MVERAPDWMRSKNVIKVKDPEHEERPDSMLLGLREGAPQSEKDIFEMEMNKMLSSVAEVMFPEMKNPYYTWSGKVVDRSESRGKLEKIRQDFLKRGKNS